MIICEKAFISAFNKLFFINNLCEFHNKHQQIQKAILSSENPVVNTTFLLIYAQK